ncbi:MAG TPA: DMT family transporter [Flavobacteriaceae bacterium]|nr:DMT family transporter [Flavobacteriaceae bacterium]
MSRAHLKSYLHYHFIVFIWGFTAVLGALISIDALPLVWYRMLLASVFVFLWVLWKKKKLKLTRRRLIILFAAGTVIAFHWLAFFAAIKVSNISITLALISTGAFFTSILEPIFYKRKVIWYELFFGIIVIFGLYLIFKVETEYLTGMIFALCAALLSAVFTLINGKIAKIEDASVISLYELGFGTMVISGYLFYLSLAGSKTGGFSLAFFSLSNSDMVYLLILALFCTAYAIIASVDVMKHLSPYTVMLTINLEPVYGILLGLLIFGSEEEMSTGFYFGAAIILSTVILNGIFKSNFKIKRKVSKSSL